MFQCPRCSLDQVYRLPRTRLERVLFSQSYECRICGHRMRVTRPMLAAVIDLFRLRYRRLISRPGMPKEF